MREIPHHSGSHLDLTVIQADSLLEKEKRTLNCPETHFPILAEKLLVRLDYLTRFQRVQVRLT